MGFGSVEGSLFTIGLGVGTLAIRRRNGPSGAVHSSNVILKQRTLHCIQVHLKIFLSSHTSIVA